MSRSSDGGTYRRLMSPSFRPHEITIDCQDVHAVAGFSSNLMDAGLRSRCLGGDAWNRSQMAVRP